MKELQSIDEIEEQCQHEIENRHLDKLIEMVAKLHLRRVSPETLQYLKEGNWEDVDHLQFFVAVLHGYWGKNSFANLRACACFHFGEMKQEVDDESLWKYQLCAIGFCLFCERIYVAFEPDHIHGLTLQGPKLEPNQPFYLEKFPDEADLPWVSRFHECKECDRYIKLRRGEIPSIPISNYYERIIEKNPDRYNYSNADFEGALNALSNHIFSDTDQDDEDDEDGYNVKEFENKSCKDKGRMQYFVVGERYTEMWVTRCNATPDIIRRCRFVYEYYSDYPSVGNLYFTDSHYGWDMIPEREVEQLLKKKYKYTKDKLKELLEEQSKLETPAFYQKLSFITNKRYLYDLQDEIKEGFPFYKIGRLNLNTLELTKNDYV